MDRVDPQRASAETQRASEETDTSVNSYIIELMERSSHDSGGSAGSRGRGRRSPTPFGEPAQQATSIPRDSMEDSQRKSGERARSMPQQLDSVDERFATRNNSTRNTPTPNNSSAVPVDAVLTSSLSTQPTPRTRMAAFHDYRQQIGTRSAMSLDQPPRRPPRVITSPSSELRISMDLPAHIGTQMGHTPDELVRARLTRKRRRLPMPWVIGFGVVSSACLCVALTTLGIGIYNFTKLRQNRAQKSIQNLEDDLRPTFQDMQNSIAAVQLGLATLLGRAGSPPQPPP